MCLGSILNSDLTLNLNQIFESKELKSRLTMTRATEIHGYGLDIYAYPLNSTLLGNLVSGRVQVKRLGRCVIFW